MPFRCAAAQASARNEGGVTTLSCKTIMAVYQVAIDDKTAANPGSEGIHHKVIHSFSSTVNHLANGCRVGIVC